MSKYLEEAAQQLRKATAEIEATFTAGYQRDRLATRREHIAEGFALLAAIDKGVLPATAAEDLLVRGPFRQETPA